MREFQPVGFVTLGTDVRLDRLAMIVVIRQRGMNIGQRQLLEIGDNLLRRPALKFVPHVNILNTDARAGDTRPATTTLLVRLNMVGSNLCHTVILAHGHDSRQTRAIGRQLPTSTTANSQVIHDD